MKKKLIALLAICILMFSLVGCGSETYDEATTKESNEDYVAGYFTIITKWGGGVDEGTYLIVYANDTNVKYLIIMCGYHYGITPLYNADGTLQIYDGE